MSIKLPLFESMEGQLAARDAELADLRARVEKAEGQAMDARRDEAQACWDAINAHIKTGPLPTQWENDQRNGMVLATNLVMARIAALTAERGGDKT